jgi:hypothetical protein
MGADLTIKKNGRYFRDSYNSWNSWSFVGMSYWGMSGELQRRGLLTKSGDVSPVGSKFVVKTLLNVKVPTFDQFVRHLQKVNYMIHSVESLSVQRPDAQLNEQYEWLRAHFKESIDFWTEAAKLRSGVTWSV